MDKFLTRIVSLIVIPILLQDPAISIQANSRVVGSVLEQGRLARLNLFAAQAQSLPVESVEHNRDSGEQIPLGTPLAKLAEGAHALAHISIPRIIEKLQVSGQASDVLTQYQQAPESEKKRLLVLLAGLLNHAGPNTRSGARWILGEIIGVPVQHHLWMIGEAKLVISAYFALANPMHQTLLREIVTSALHEPRFDEYGGIFHDAAAFVLERINGTHNSPMRPPALAPNPLEFSTTMFTRTGSNEELRQRIGSLMAAKTEMINIPGLSNFNVLLIGQDSDMAINEKTGRPIYVGDISTAGSSSPHRELFIARGCYVQNRQTAIQLANHYAVGLEFWWQFAEQLLAAGVIRPSDAPESEIPIFQAWVQDNRLFCRVFQALSNIEAQRLYPVLLRGRSSLENDLKDLADAAQPGMWAKQHTPLVASKTFVSFQMEMGFDPDLTRHLEEVIQERVVEGDLLADQAEELVDLIAQATMGGGLGALMPDLVPGIAENGGETVSVQVLYQHLRDTNLIEAGDYIREALRRMGYEYREIQVTLKSGETYSVGCWIGAQKLGWATQIWLDEKSVFDHLYADPPNGVDRARQMALFNEAAQTILVQLKQEGFLKGDGWVLLENEVYVSLVKKALEGLLIAANHSILLNTIPRFNRNLAFWMWGEEGIGDPNLLVDDLLSLTETHANRARLRGGKIIGVSSEHSNVLGEMIFPKHKDLITYDDNTNGVYLSHWQPMRLRTMIMTYWAWLIVDNRLQSFDDPAAFFDTLEASPYWDIFLNQFDAIKEEESRNLLQWLQKRFGVQWEFGVNSPIGMDMRRIVPYKCLDTLVFILRHAPYRERFLRSGVRLLIGGRDFEGPGGYAATMQGHLEQLMEEFPVLKDRIALIPDYSISMAQRNLFRAVSFTLMMAQRFMEAAATSPQKGLVDGGLSVSVRNGAPLDWLKDWRETGEDGNGLYIEYEQEHPSDPAYREWVLSLPWVDHEKVGDRPSALSLVESFEALRESARHETTRKRRQYNALKTGMIDADIARRQARGILRIAERQLENNPPVVAGASGLVWHLGVKDLLDIASWESRAAAFYVTAVMAGLALLLAPVVGVYSFVLLPALLWIVFQPFLWMALWVMDQIHFKTGVVIPTMDRPVAGDMDLAKKATRTFGRTFDWKAVAIMALGVSLGLSTPWGIALVLAGAFLGEHYHRQGNHEVLDLYDGARGASELVGGVPFAMGADSVHGGKRFPDPPDKIATALREAQRIWRGPGLEGFDEAIESLRSVGTPGYSNSSVIRHDASGQGVAFVAVPIHSGRTALPAMLASKPAAYGDAGNWSFHAWGGALFVQTTSGLYAIQDPRNMKKDPVYWPASPRARNSKTKAETTAIEAPIVNKPVRIDAVVSITVEVGRTVSAVPTLHPSEPISNQEFRMRPAGAEFTGISLPTIHVLRPEDVDEDNETQFVPLARKVAALLEEARESSGPSDQAESGPHAAARGTMIREGPLLSSLLFWLIPASMIGGTLWSGFKNQPRISSRPFANLLSTAG